MYMRTGGHGGGIPPYIPDNYHGSAMRRYSDIEEEPIIPPPPPPAECIEEEKCEIRCEKEKHGKGGLFDIFGHGGEKLSREDLLLLAMILLLSGGGDDEIVVFLALLLLFR